MNYKNFCNKDEEPQYKDDDKYWQETANGWQLGTEVETEEMKSFRFFLQTHALWQYVVWWS